MPCISAAAMVVDIASPAPIVLVNECITTPGQSYNISAVIVVATLSTFLTVTYKSLPAVLAAVISIAYHTSLPATTAVGCPHT